MSVGETSASDVTRARQSPAAAVRDWWLWALTLGAFARIFCALFVSNSLDMRFYGSVALDGQLHRPLYADGLFSYPPLWGYVLEAAGKIAMLLHIRSFVRAYDLSPYTVPGLNSIDLTTPAMSLLIKLPIITLDVLMLLLIVAVLRQLGVAERAARLAAIGWWLNPVVIFCSAVNASWDVVVPLSMLALLMLASSGRWFASGALVAVGVLAKLAPLYAGFLAFAMALRRDARTPLATRVLLFVAGGAAFTLVALLPVLFWNEFAAMRSAVFTRTGTFVVGGASLWSFTALQPFAGVRDFLSDQRGLIALTSMLAILATAAAAGLALIRFRSLAFADCLYAIIGVVSVVLVVTPFTQPTYALWLLPFALVLAACGHGFWKKYTIWLSGVTTVFVLTIRSPFDLLAPLCYFSHLCSSSAAGQLALSYRTWPFPFAENFQIGFDAIAGEVTCAIYVVGVVAAVRYLLGRMKSSSALAAAPVSLPCIRRPVLASGAGGLAIALLLAAVPAPAAPLIDVHPARNSVVIASRGFAGVVHTVRFADVPTILTVYVYRDDHYAEGRGVSPTFVGGFANHLMDDARSRSLGVRVRPVDAVALPRVLRGRTRGVALTVMGGILPATVRTKQEDLLQSWIARGGLVFWAGEPFDVLFSQRASRDAAPVVSQPDYSKWRSWYANGSLFPATVDPYFAPLTHGTVRSIYWNLARLSFSKTTFPCNTGPLLKHGGYPLAFLDKNVNSSVSAIPYGRGRIVLYGDGFDDEILAAESVAQVLATGVWYHPERIVQEDGFIAPSKLPMTVPNLRKGTHLFAFGNAAPDGAPFGTAVVR